MTKSLKTPLRYPGGKSRAVKKINPYIGDLSSYQQYREPFLGGGSVALHVSKMYPKLDIWVSDLYEPLINFWTQLQESGQELQDIIMDYKSSHLGNNPNAARQLFNIAKGWINDKTKNNIDRAAAFYIVNKCSFSGLTESSSFSPRASVSNFSVRGISKLNEYSKLISQSGSRIKIDNFSAFPINLGSFDNNILCIGEKQVFVVDSVADELKSNMIEYGAHELNSEQIKKLTEVAFKAGQDMSNINWTYCFCRYTP